MSRETAAVEEEGEGEEEELDSIACVLLSCDGNKTTNFGPMAILKRCTRKKVSPFPPRKSFIITPLRAVKKYKIHNASPHPHTLIIFSSSSCSLFSFLGALLFCWGQVRGSSMKTRKRRILTGCCCCRCC